MNIDFETCHFSVSLVNYTNTKKARSKFHQSIYDVFVSKMDLISLVVHWCRFKTFVRRDLFDETGPRA